jgi:hypothetical protein
VGRISYVRQRARSPLRPPHCHCCAWILLVVENTAYMLPIIGMQLPLKTKSIPTYYYTILLYYHQPLICLGHACRIEGSRMLISHHAIATCNLIHHACLQFPMGDMINSSSTKRGRNHAHAWCWSILQPLSIISIMHGPAAPGSQFHPVVKSLEQLTIARSWWCVGIPALTRASLMC